MFVFGERTPFLRLLNDNGMFPSLAVLGFACMLNINWIFLSWHIFHVPVIMHEIMQMSAN